MLNFTYDAPVKLFAPNLLLMAALLVAPDGRRLLNVLFLNRTAPPAELGTFANGRWTGRRLRATRAVVESLAVSAGLGLPLTAAWRGNHTYGDNAPRPPLYGIWDVERFVANGDTLAPLTTDPARWRRVIVGRPGSATVQMMSDSVRRFSAVADPVARTLRLASRSDSSVRYAFRHDRAGDTLRLDGTLGTGSLHLRLRRVDHARFLLLARGFHWVQELPFNR